MHDGRARRHLALALLTIGLSSACTGAEAPRPAPETVTVTAPAASSSASASGTVTADRSDDRLSLALLSVPDLPPGFTQESASPTQGEITSKDPQCAPFVAIVNRRQPTGSAAHAGSQYAGGQLGPFIAETIDAFANEAAVATAQAQLRAAVAQCPGATAALPGQASVPIVVESVTAPNLGENPVAFRMTVDAAGKSPTGTFAFTQVYTGVKDTVVTLSFVAAQPDQVEELTRVAVDRAGTVLG